MKDLSIYIHIPFCVSKCHYCDFLSFPNVDSEIISRYIEALGREIETTANSVGNDFAVRTVFIGGGTPTCIESDHIVKILELVRRHYNLASDAELSIESNPATFNKDKLKAYKNAGINRISIGLQCWQDTLLEGIGRIHKHGDFVRGFYEAKEAGLNNINVDLMFGLPNQKLGDWNETLSNVCKLNPSHISCYSLTLEEGTVMYNQFKEGKIRLDDKVDRKMYHSGTAFLKDRGYCQYEISNYAKPGRECRHNLVYWELKDYIGLGLGAHSFLRGIRYRNEEVFDAYIQKLESGHSIIKDSTVLTAEQLKEEFLFLGLRKIKGIEDRDYKEKFDSSVFEDYEKVINKLSKDDYIRINGGNIRLSEKGLDFANHVFMNFLID